MSDKSGTVFDITCINYVIFVETLKSIAFILKSP